MNLEIENKIQEAIPLIKNKTHILHFSTGADSVACFLRLRELGIEPILIYNYYLPHIPMVDNYIDYFEKKFNVHIYRLPSAVYLKNIDNALYQLPIKARETFRNHITDFNLVRKNEQDKQRKDILEAIGKKKDEVIFHKGLKYSDGFFRYHAIVTHGPLTKDNTFSPIASFTSKDICNILRKYDCKLPIEYGYAGISFESPRGFNILGLKEECPKSFEYICKYFPMSRCIAFRDRYAKKDHFKTRIAQFKEFVMDKKDYEIW